MGLLDELRALFRREAADARQWAEEATEDANASLDRAERRISDDPNVRLQATLDDIAEGDTRFTEIRERAAGRAALGDARSEVDDAAGQLPPGEPRDPDGPETTGQDQTTD